MWEFESELTVVIQRTPSIKTFRFPIRARGVRYLPGQFFFLTIKVQGEEAQHHFSFSSSPTEKGYVEFTKRITSSDFSQALNVLKPGDWARLHGPSGNFTLSRKYQRLVFLSGGIGITPLRSMLRYIVDKELPYDVTLVYGNSTFDEIAFREELDGFVARRRGIRVEHVLSGQAPAGWKGNKGLITGDLVARLVPDHGDRLFYISGPPRMVTALEEQVANIGIPTRQVKRDSFTGYD